MGHRAPQMLYSHSPNKEFYPSEVRKSNDGEDYTIKKAKSEILIIATLSNEQNLEAV